MSKLLAKLAPHAKLPDGSAPGGITTLTAEDVAGACAGMSRHAYLYALVKFAGYHDAGTVSALRVENRWAAARIARLKGWKIDARRVARLADLALTLSLCPPICRRCGGGGVTHSQRQCRACGGSGAGREMSAREKARAVGVDHKSWPTYAPRLDVLLLELSFFDDHIARHVRRRVRDQ